MLPIPERTLSPARQRRKTRRLIRVRDGRLGKRFNRIDASRWNCETTAARFCILVPVASRVSCVSSAITVEALEMRFQSRFQRVMQVHARACINVHIYVLCIDMYERSPSLQRENLERTCSFFYLALSCNCFDDHPLSLSLSADAWWGNHMIIDWHWRIHQRSVAMASIFVRLSSRLHRSSTFPALGEMTRIHAIFTFSHAAFLPIFTSS